MDTLSSPTTRLFNSPTLRLLDSPTLRLLNTSTIVASAGCFRLYVAILLAAIIPTPLIIIAYGLIVYSTYTLDRAFGCEEDTVNRSELSGANKYIGISVSMFAFLTGALILATDQIYLASILPFIIGYIYSKGLSFGGYKLKLKGSMGSKNVVIGLTWGGSIALIISRFTPNILTVAAVFFFFGIKMFINSTLFDFKDVKGDLASGIRTLPVCLGETRTKCLLFGLCISLYSGMILSMLYGFIHPEWTLLAVSFLFTASFIIFYSVGFEERTSGIIKKFRQWMVIGEWPVALLLQGAVNLII
ncbi:UbiA family prenyltransferase [Methanoregula sp.]|jgi:4-hydroxybenzoate polyprenyltransferase|uniref:UbiA family prenyltransferase n=1 Tax=Methanoregula sp. TaxID=2052170 RepID=UPI003C18FA22